MVSSQKLQRHYKQTHMATTQNNDSKNAWTEKELGCLWRKETKTGDKYLTGVLSGKKLKALLAAVGDGDIQLVSFSNKKKTKDTQPDFHIYLSEKRDSAPTTNATRPAASTSAPRPAARQAAPAAAPVDASDLI